MNKSRKTKQFTQLLIEWNEKLNRREMPWKGIKDPYKIWLSEIILQQTRVEQGWNYYESFIEKYPDIFSLAQAEDRDVFKLWEGLGYYNRCKNLLHTARQVVEEWNGIFKQDYQSILSLKGIGPYTAAAICSFAFDQPYAVVDGNVFRVLARIFGIHKAIDSTEGKVYFSKIAQETLDKKQPGKYNQAIMDFGATMCKPAQPLCNDCIMRNICVANQQGLVNQLPIKEKYLQKKLRYVTWIKIVVKNEIYVHLRTQNDVWKNLYEFYWIENEERKHWDKEATIHFFKHVFKQPPLRIEDIQNFEQQLTHQKIKAQIITVFLAKKPTSLKNQLWVQEKDLNKYAFPKLITTYENKKD